MSDFTATARAFARDNKYPVEAAGVAKGFTSGARMLAGNRLYRCGLRLSNNAGDVTNDIDIAAGECADTSGGELIVLAAMTKRLDAGWAAGSGAGMRNSAAAIADTTYHLFGVCKAGGADPDVYALGNAQGTTAAAALSALQAESGGAAYVHAQRLGRILRESGAIVAFKQTGDRFMRHYPAASYGVANPGTSAAIPTLHVPLGGGIDALVTATLADATPSGNTFMLVSDLDHPDIAPGAGAGTYSVAVSGAAAKATIPDRSVGAVRVPVNALAQCRNRLSDSQVDMVAALQTDGWIESGWGFG